MSIKVATTNQSEQKISHIDEAEKTVHPHVTQAQPISPTHHITHHEKAKFYSGEESVSLPSSALKRVRDLQAANDELQRHIAALRHDCSLSQDPLKIMNDIGYAQATVARNTGEIMNIFLQNEKRLAQIAELEKHNINLQQEITDTMSAFGVHNEQEKKIHCATGYFSAKTNLDHNVLLLQQLKNAA